MVKRKQFISGTCGVLLLALIIAPPVTMCWYVLTHGGNNFSDDYVSYLPFFNLALTGKATLQNWIFQLHGPHLVIIPIALRLMWLKLEIWSPHIEILTSLIIGGFRVAAIYALVSRSFLNSGMRLGVIALASITIFAPAQLSLYVYGDAGLTMGIDSLGFLLGLAVIVRMRESWCAIFLVILCGFLSALSWGIGVTWGIFLVAMALAGWRSKLKYIAVFVSACLATAPLALALFKSRGAGSAIVSLFDLRFLVGALGRPMSPAVDNIDPHYLYGLVMGTVAIVIALALVIYISAKRGTDGIHHNPALQTGLLLLIYSLACLYQVSLFRGGIGSWYVALSANFWIGISIMLLALIVKAGSSKKREKTIAVGTLCILACLFVASNYSFQHKTPFLLSRGLPSEACVRNYQNSPTFCELKVFNWQPTYVFAGFSNYFDQAQIGVFGSTQTWTLQGDYILPTVRPIEPGLSRVHWTAHKRPADWNSADRLDLVLPLGTSIDWKVTLPDQIEAAHLRFNTRGDPRVTLRSESGQTVVFTSGRSGDISLDQFIGETLTINLASSDRDAVISYPRVEVKQTRESKVAVPIYQAHVPWVPTNTEKSAYFPQPTPNDAVLDGPGTIVWKKLSHKPFSSDKGICLGDYQAIQFTVALPKAIAMRLLTLTLEGVNAAGVPVSESVNIALMQDTDQHSYSYDTHLLTLGYDSRIYKVRFSSPWGAGGPSEQDVQLDIHDVRFVHKSRNAICSSG